MKLLGQNLIARDFDRQVAEIQVRIVVLNGYTALGIPVTEVKDKSVRGKGKPGRQRICATNPISPIGDDLPDFGAIGRDLPGSSL